MWLFTIVYKKALASLGILSSTILLKIYVDDLNQVELRLPYGSIYRKGRLHIPGVDWIGKAGRGLALSRTEKEEIELRQTT